MMFVVELIAGLNDVVANFGVILAGFLVSLSNLPLPDLIIGSIIAIIVLYGSINVIRDARLEQAKR